VSYGDWAWWKKRTEERWREQGEGAQVSVCCLECRASPICGPCYAEQEPWARLIQEQLGANPATNVDKETIARSAAR
jgi:hypothetical protein